MRSKSAIVPKWRPITHTHTRTHARVWQMYYRKDDSLISLCCVTDVLQHNSFTGLRVLCGRCTAAQLFMDTNMCCVADVLLHSCFAGLCVLCGRCTTAQLFYWYKCVLCGRYTTAHLFCWTQHIVTAQLFYWSVCVPWQMYYGTAVLLVCVCCVADALRHSCFTGLCVLCGRWTAAQLFYWRTMIHLFYWSVCFVWQTCYSTTVLLVCVCCVAVSYTHLTLPTNHRV